MSYYSSHMQATYNKELPHTIMISILKCIAWY